MKPELPPPPSAPRPARVLVVDDDTTLVEFLVESLEDHGIVATGMTNPRAALEASASSSYDLVLADVEMPELRGPDLLARLLERDPERPVILMTAFGSIELAVQCLRAGAVDFLTKPFPTDALLHAVRRALRERRLEHEVVRLKALVDERDTGGLVAKSQAMKRVIEIARRAAQTLMPVLLTGPSGVGKSSVAAFIHRVSARAQGPLVTVNCAALPTSLAEAELFGARKGAYTGASETREGLFMRAHEGTLFLDEVGELPLEVQPKLLEALESGRVRPLGGDRELVSSARIVAATNLPLERAVEERRFRQDLFFRLNVLRIEIPPLSRRLEDLPELVEALVERAARRAGREVHGIASDALRRLLAHHWPGNVRELANVLERAVVLSECEVIGAEDLLFDAFERSGGDVFEEAVTRRLPLAEVELAYIRRILEAVGGSKVEAAKVLGIDRRTLYRRLGEG